MTVPPLGNDETVKNILFPDTPPLLSTTSTAIVSPTDCPYTAAGTAAVSYTHLRAHET